MPILQFLAPLFYMSALNSVFAPYSCINVSAESQYLRRRLGESLTTSGEALIGEPLMKSASVTWSFTPNAFEHSMPMSALINIDGKDATSGTLVAFAGKSVRGMGSSNVIPFGPHAGQAVFMVMVYSNVKSREEITFRHAPDELTGLPTSAKPKRLTSTRSTELSGIEEFVANTKLGDALKPLAFRGTTSARSRPIPSLLPSALLESQAQCGEPMW